jgi:hypothetical protein
MSRSQWPIAVRGRPVGCGGAHTLVVPPFYVILIYEAVGWVGPMLDHLARSSDARRFVRKNSSS